jgi:hypothetical protein
VLLTVSSPKEIEFEDRCRTTSNVFFAFTGARQLNPNRVQRRVPYLL